MKKVVAIGELLIDFVPQQRGCALDEVVQFERVAGRCAGQCGNRSGASRRQSADDFAGGRGCIRYAHSQNAARKRREHLNGVPHRTGEYRAGVCFTCIRTATASFPSTQSLGRPVSR